MSESAIRTAIYNAVSGVTNVGKVYDYERYSNDWTATLNLYKTTIGGTDQIRGWVVGYRGIQEAAGGRFTAPGGRISRKHRFQILGVMGLQDATETEKTFAAVAEDVCDALDSDATIHGYLGTSPATMSYEPATFAGILVYAAAIVVDVTEAI